MATGGYPSDLSDGEYAVIAPHMPAPCRRGRPRRWPWRAVLDAVFYVVRTERADTSAGWGSGSGCRRRSRAWHPHERDDSPLMGRLVRDGTGHGCVPRQDLQGLGAVLRRELEGG